MSEILAIKTLACDICDKYDTIRLSQEEIQKVTSSTDLGIGAKSIIHNDHTRIIYFDEHGNYLGDTIALSEKDTNDNEFLKLEKAWEWWQSLDDGTQKEFIVKLYEQEGN